MASTLPGTAAAPGGRGAPIETGKSDVAAGPNPTVRLVLIALGVVALIVALIFGIKFLAYATTHETTDDATIDADVVQVTSKIAERVNHIYVDTDQPVKKGQLLVTLDDANERDSYNQAAAAVAAQQAQYRAAVENVALTRATQLAQNEQNQGSIVQYQAGISSAAAQAQSASQQIAASAAAVDTARAQLKAAQDAVPGAEQNLAKATADLQRTQSLVSTGDESRAMLDASRAGYEAARSQASQAQADAGAAQAALDEAEQKLNAQRYATLGTQSQIGVQQGQLSTAQGHLAESDAPERVSAQQAQAEAARAQVASLRAQLATASTNLGYTRIVADIDGYVGQKNVEIGQTVAPGESLLTLIPATHVYITANYKETQVGHMHVGQPVDISIDAYKGVAFEGHLSDLSPASQNTFSLVPAQNATGNFVKVTQRLPVRILFDRVENGNLGDYALRPGMSVETSVKVK
jgi:membrane fusion protein, multidrug efflux system